jgi:capsular polysaccharide transport system permease protein
MIQKAFSSKFALRHFFVVFSFVLCVLAPVGYISHYLIDRALDQFTSTLAFTVRVENSPTASDLFGGINFMGGNSASDSDILYEYISSQPIVEEIDKELNLEQIYSSKYDQDPWFSLKPNSTIEDLTEYWGRMVQVTHDSGTGLIEIRVHAFDPLHANELSSAIYEKSSALINKLNYLARQDAVKYAKDEFEQSLKTLKNARLSIRKFRSHNMLIDPEVETQMLVGVLNALQLQLSELIVERDLILSTSSADDPRIQDIEIRIDVVNRRILTERNKFKTERADTQNFTNMLTEYEALVIDLEYAEKNYLAARATYDSARLDSQRQSRYLAAHILPTLAERADHPKRTMLIIVSFFISLGVWFFLVIVSYAVRDRR